MFGKYILQLCVKDSVSNVSHLPKVTNTRFKDDFRNIKEAEKKLTPSNTILFNRPGSIVLVISEQYCGK